MSAPIPQQRALPPPWSVEETGPCFIVRDANQQALAFVYCETSRDGVQRQAADPREARRIAANTGR